MSNSYYLDIPGIDGGVSGAMFAEDFELSDYSIGATIGLTGAHPVYQPLVMTLPEAGTPGANALAADAANGTVIPTMTLEVTNSAGQIIEKITLTNATVVQAAEASGGATFAFEYQKISTTTYQPSGNGSVQQGPTITSDVTQTGGTFAPPPAAAPSTTLSAGDALFLNVSGDTGPPGTARFPGDFQPKSYQFAIGTDGKAGPLVLDLGATADAKGVATLYGDTLTGATIPTVTLIVEHTQGVSVVVRETITLTDAVATSYTDPSGDVSVSFNYASAKVTSQYVNANGSLGTAQTVTLTGSATPPPAVAVVPEASASSVYLSIPGIDGGTTSLHFPGDFDVSGYSLGATAGTAGHPVYEPLVVTLPEAGTPGANALAADAANGTVIPTMTLEVTNSAGQIIEKITLTNATVVQAAEASGGATFAFEYQKISTTTYQVSGNGSVQQGPTITSDVTLTHGTFAAPPATASSTTLSAGDALFLNVSGDTGPSTTGRFPGDFQPKSYQFAIGTDGKAGPLVLDLGATADAKGVATLYGDTLTGATIPTVTLIVEHTQGISVVVRETITLTDAVATSYTDPSGNVSVSFNYASAKVTSQDVNANGSLGTAQTVTLTGSATPPPTVAVVPEASASSVYLSIPGIDGGTTSPHFPGDFDVSGYSVGAAAGTAGHPVYEPLVVTLPEGGTTGANALAADAANGTLIPTMTLEVTNSAGQVVETITLTNATVVQAAEASGGATFAFEYQKISTTTYQASGNGSLQQGPTITSDLTQTGGTFTAPPTAAPSTTLPVRETLFLKVPGDAGPAGTGVFAGDFQPQSYQFAIGTDGKAGPLVLDLGATADAKGVATLYGDTLAGTTIPTVTLYVQQGTTTGSVGVIETITLTDAVATSYTDPSGDVSVAFDYATATLTSRTQSSNGSLGTTHTVTLPGQESLCYRRGTAILTPTGEVPIENLRIGDRVVTRFAGLQPIKWIGRQSYGLRFVRGSAATMPVRIAAGALGENLPARDLFVSPGHSMLVDGTLILARNLVNGITITQPLGGDATGQIDYFQIELEHHDCVIAEGTFSETYADGPGLRAQYHNVAEFWALYPDHCPAEELALCAPRPERGVKLWRTLGPIVERAGQGRTLGPLEGFIEMAEDFRLEGWAMDAAHPNLPVQLDIFLADDRIATALAADYRPDLVAAGKGRGACSFALNLPLRLRPETRATLSVRRHEDGAALRRLHALPVAKPEDGRSNGLRAVA